MEEVYYLSIGEESGDDHSAEVSMALQEAGLLGDEDREKVYDASVFIANFA